MIIEYLDRFGDGAPLVPGSDDEALDVRLWDRFFDQYVQSPMQKVVADRMRSSADRDPAGTAEAHATLKTAYAMLEQRMATRPWAASDRFTMADCAAAPALFYASVVSPPDPENDALLSYLQRLTDRPAFARVLQEAKPHFRHFPFADAIPDRFR